MPFSSRNGGLAVKVDRTPLTVMLLLAAVAAGQLLHYYPKLPETIAMHFGPSGQANGWSGKAVFFPIYGAIEAAIVLAGLAMAFFGERMPASFLNMPNRNYWLSPERRAESLSFFWTQTIWIEAITLAFLIVVAQVVFRANLAGGEPTLARDFVVVVVLFVAAVVWQSARIVRRFSRSGA
jgi:uncharacterized membrane protein